MHRFIMRQARTHDFEDVRKLAYILNSVNLPDEDNALREVLAHSEASFKGELPHEKCEYIFVLEDRGCGRVIGMSSVIAQHGTVQMPHLFFQCEKKTHFSSNLGLEMRHEILSLGMDTNGPSEIGRLILEPAYRQVPERLGRFLSYVRFFYIGMYKNRFQPRILAELLPPLKEEGGSHLWDALGGVLTGLEYEKADHLSRTQKEFIVSLFPKTPIYTALLPPKAQAVIGKVGQATKAAQALLEAVGFSFEGRVDPFDGGPHYEADIAKIAPVRDTKSCRAVAIHEHRDSQIAHKIPRAILGHSRNPFTKDAEFRAIMTSCLLDFRGNVYLSEESMQALGLKSGEEVSLLVA